MNETSLSTDLVTREGDPLSGSTKGRHGTPGFCPVSVGRWFCRFSWVGSTLPHRASTDVEMLVRASGNRPMSSLGNDP